MHIHISNESYEHFHSSYKALREKFKSEYAFSYTLIVKKSHDVKRFYRFLIDNGVNHIFFNIDIEKLNNSILFLANRYNISLILNINNKLSSYKLSLLKRIKTQSKVIDKRKNGEPSYKVNKHIVYTKNDIDQIFEAHLLSLSLLKMSFISCENSSCINKTIYIEGDNLYFCPHDKRSYIGTLSDLDNLYNVESFMSILKDAIDKRNECKLTCKYYALCMGGCPLKIKKECIKDELDKKMKETKEFLDNKTNLESLENSFYKEIYYSYISSKSR